MTVNNYGSIFVKIDRNVLMLNEFFALHTLSLPMLAHSLAAAADFDTKKNTK
jgi:hypothetical protein